jgi:hypothetical protein
MKAFLVSLILGIIVLILTGNLLATLIVALLIFAIL